MYNAAFISADAELRDVKIERLVFIKTLAFLQDMQNGKERHTGYR
jgi:hypothetical protein